MTNSTIFFAVAGAGKTYSICQRVNQEERNLILSFTNQNINNVLFELSKRSSFDFSNTCVMTFDSFVLDYFIWPFIKLIPNQFFNKNILDIKQVNVNNSPGYNPDKPWLSSQKRIEYYFSGEDDHSYSIRLDRCTTLIMKDCFKFKNGKTLFDMGMERVNLFFDNVYIDEFQDYRCEDYKFLIKLAKNVKSSYLFGDYYQNSVSATNNHGIPFNKGNTFEKFKKDLKKQGFTIDDTALIKSRRCTKDVCTFVRDNLNIQMYEEPSMKRVGIIKYIFDYKDLLPLINVSSIKIISINNERKWGSISIGLSKGNTYESTIVVIPDADIMLTENGTFRLGKIASPIVRNKIYVAITRATGTVYLTRSEVLDHAFGYI